MPTTHNKPHPSHPPYTPPPLLAILILTFLQTTVQLLTIDSLQISALTNYTIELTQFINAPAGSLIQLQLPWQYSVDDLKQRSPYSGDVFDGTCPIDCTGVGISYSGLIFNITGMFPSSQFIILKYSIKNVPNPRTALSVSGYTIRVIDPSHTIIFSQNPTSRTFLPKTMTCTAIATDTTSINFISTAYFQISPVTNPSDAPLALIMVQFPNSWTNQPLISSTLTTDLYCLSSSQPQIKCSRSSQIINLLNVSYAASINFQIHSLQNPSSIMNTGLITVSTMTRSRVKLDTCSIYATAFTQDFLRIPAFSITYTSNTYMQISASATFPTKVAAGTIVHYTFPTNLPLTGSSCQAYLAGTLLNSVTPTYISSNNTVIINPFTSLIFKPNIQIKCINVLRPRTATVIGNISFGSYYNGNLVASVSCCSTVLQARASLDVSSIVTDKPFLQTSNAQYIFTMSTTIPIKTTDMIYIYFPKQFSIGSSGTKTCTIGSASAIVGTPTCTLSKGNLIKITSFITSDVSSPTTFQLTINSLQNPTKNPSSTPFQIYIVNSLQQIVQYNETATVTISAALINVFAVTAVNRQVLYSPAQYNFDFVTNGLVMANYYVIVRFPSTVGVDQSLLSCKITGQNYPCWYTSSGNQVRIRITSNFVSNTLSLIIQGCINPDSLAPTTNFNLQILDSTSNIIQISSILLTTSITMNSTKQFKKSYINFNSTSLTFPLIHSANILQIIAISPLTIKSSHKLTISYISSQILFNSASSPSQCNTPFLCTFDLVNNIITISNFAYTPNLDTIYLNITNTIPLVSKPTLTLQLLNSANYKILSNTATVTTLPDFIEYNLTQSSWEYGATTDLTISYSISALGSSIPSLSTSTNLAYILVYVPKQYTTNSTDNIYNITTLTGQISITNSLTNPLASSSVSLTSSSYFYLVGYSINSQIIAISINNKKFSTVCTMPCRQCQSTNITQCLSCYSWYVANLLYINQSSSPTNSSTCVTHCPQYYYQNTTTESCQKCDTNCLECDKFIANKCVSCNTGTYLHEVDYKCYTDCPSGFYQVIGGGVCRGCMGYCLTCLNQSFCYTCATGYYFYTNKCIVACPPTTYTILTPLSCINCPTPNCLHCSQSECLACKPPYYLYNKLCYTSCPVSLYPTLSLTCKACQCLTCSNYANNCTSCLVAAPYLYNNYCYKDCPMGMYPGNLNVCTYCPLSCVTCVTYQFCTLCKQTYALFYNSSTIISCISSSTCPANTILTLSSTDQPICSPCTPPCATCSITVTFCLTCLTDYNLHNNTCVLTCPTPYHPIQKQCRRCITNCLLCQTSDPQNCTECQANYFLYNFTCYSSCLIGTYTDVQNKQCVGCNSVCRTCSNATNCTSCASGFLYNWFCYASCPTTPILFYQYNGVCTRCQPQCTACINSPVQCTACSNSNYLYNVITYQCTFQCIAPYFKNGSFCIGCQAPCLTCDTTYNSCSSCLNNLYTYNGTCLASCPNGYYQKPSTHTCQPCTFPCKLCIENQCLLCQSFSYMYKNLCVLTCPQDMPYEQPGYCSECIGIGFCARCAASDTTNSQICTQCVYPYVLFQQTCLNSCPTNYTVTITNSLRKCTISAQYQLYLKQKQIYNRPILPPFLITFLYLLTILVLGLTSSKVYRFTYHVGYMIGILAIYEGVFGYYSLYFVYMRYQGQYIPITPILPSILILTSIICNYFILTIIFYVIVLKNNYTKDPRYIEWKDRNLLSWWVLTILMFLLGGPRVHKLNYSKLFGLERFSYRIVSVQKFYQQDIIVLWSSIGDILGVVAGFVCVYNTFVGYNGVLFIGYEIFLIKLIMWTLILYDLKKPDRGFFIGDQQKAEQQILNQLEQQAKKLNRIDTQNFAKLVRTKSAQVIRNPKYFGNIDVDDFISVYNPDDYEEVIKVSNKKIQKNIYKGKYRKGRKITIQQKINKFVDSIKPRPKIDKDKTDAYLWKLIYWKPPNFKKVKPKQNLPPSEQSLLKLLQLKEQQYKQQLDALEDVQQQKNQRKYYVRPRYDQRTFLDDLDQTIPNETVEFFYPSHSIETNPKQNSLDFDDLMNLNYARKKHLNKDQNNQSLKQQSKRKLHHQPQKKRRNLKGFGQMVLKNQY